MERSMADARSSADQRGTSNTDFDLLQAVRKAGKNARMEGHLSQSNTDLWLSR